MTLVGRFFNHWLRREAASAELNEAKPYPTSQSIVEMILWDYLALLEASRAILFDLEEDGIEELLIAL